MKKLIIFILILGILYKLLLTANGNFLFNMDNARDMVDVREMVVLHKIRFTGPNAAIEGVYNGPFWYYLLTLPFVLSGGNPYGSILMEFVLWAIGGFFLLKIVAKWSKWLILPVGLVWIASDYISLTTAYAFNPNPVPLLTPLFIYLLYKYIETKRVGWGIGAQILGGLFFNFEMNFGVFIWPIIFISILILKRSIFKLKSFWFSNLFFLLCLLPQAFFEVKHKFIMTSSVMNFLKSSTGGGGNLFIRFQSLFESFVNVFSATFMNHKGFTLIILLILLPLVINSFKRRGKDLIVLISCIYIIVPFVFYIFLPVSVNPWHLGGEAVALVILAGFLIKASWDLNFKGKIVSLIITVILMIYSFSNIGRFIFHDRVVVNLDPSSYKNEIAAIDYVYQHAKGQNFKVYIYLPSVYDYPYQYLFWWYGQKKYGFIPGEYVYSPRKPVYIPSQDKFQGRKDNLSGLVFLIKEPDRIKMRQAWEDDYQNMKFVSKEMLGNIEVEVRQEVRK